MINQNHDAINYCENCDVEYIAPASAPCPLCPLQEAFNVAYVRVSLTEPFNLLTATEDWEIEQLINSAVAADDWFLTKFRLACAVREGTWQTTTPRCSSERDTTGSATGPPSRRGERPGMLIEKSESKSREKSQ